MQMIARLAFFAILAISSSLAWAQTAPPTNPLRPASSRNAQPAAPAPAAAENRAREEAGAETKAKRPRSPAQLANDNRMRACGKEWRENKAKLAGSGKTWRVFNVECRARLKAAGQ